MPTSEANITHALSPDEIQARIAALSAPPTSAQDAFDESVVEYGASMARQLEQERLYSDGSPMDPDVFRFYRPLVGAADEYAAWAKTTASRIYTGLPEFDDAMRGTAPGELTLVQGYTHSGKTVFVTQVVMHNKHRRVAWFTPDETQVLVLVKLACAIHGISAEALEQRLGQEDPEAKRMLRETATAIFPNLAVFDLGMTREQMSKALRETEQAQWGGQTAELVVYDYAALHPEGEDVKAKISMLKGWGKAEAVPLYLLTQSSRTAGKDGQKVTIDSGEFGGEQQATHVVGVRRKKAELTARINDLQEKLLGAVSDAKHDSLTEQLREAESDLRRHQSSITFSLVKNKRPPSRLVDDIDFTLDGDTGRVRPYEMPRAPSAAEILGRGRSSGYAVPGGQQEGMWPDGEPF